MNWLLDRDGPWHESIYAETCLGGSYLINLTPACHLMLHVLLLALDCVLSSRLVQTWRIAAR